MRMTWTLWPAALGSPRLSLLSPTVVSGVTRCWRTSGRECEPPIPTTSAIEAAAAAATAVPISSGRRTKLRRLGGIETGI